LSKEGKPIIDASITIDFIRASSMKDDKKYVLKPIKEGVYHVTTDLPFAGCWQLKIMAIKGDDQYEVRGNIEVFERINGKIIERICAIGAPEMDTAR
jgi:nitrogen fixation protein FixH